ncbi:hypothetical protein FNF31_00464 [Cafeteria roenbergensis]|nr:hypothetical protein FNF31_00464 [Cafeteria roenbergensis]
MPDCSCWRAVERSPTLRWVALVLATVQAMSTGAAFYGWASIVPLLAAREPFASMDDTEQTLELGLIFTVASSLTFIMPVITGTILDHYGPRVATRIGSSLFAIGISVILAAVATGQNLYMAGFIIIASVGTMLLHPSFSIAALFPEFPGTVLSILNGCFDASAVVFLIIAGIERAGLPLTTVLIMYLCGPVLLILLLAAFLWPPRPFKSQEKAVAEAESEAHARGDSTTDTATGKAAGTAPEDLEAATGDEEAKAAPNSTGRRESEAASETGIELTGMTAGGSADATRPSGKDAGAASADATPAPAAADGAASSGTADGAVAASPKAASSSPSPSPSSPHIGRTILQQAASLEFVLLTLYMAQSFVRFNTYLGTVDSLLKSITDDSGPYLAAFGIILPAGALTVLAAGAIIDRFGISTACACLSVLALLVNGLSMVPDANVQYLTFFCFAAYRAFLFSFATTYIAERFGFPSVGRLLGAISIVGGCASFLQYPLLAVALEQSPVSFDIPNGIMLGLGVVALGFPAHLFYKYGAMMPTQG